MNPSESPDWNAAWKSYFVQRDNSMTDCSSYWDTVESARRYLKDYGTSDRVTKTIKAISLKQDSRVLEIGAGPGVLAVPIADQCAHVTAVEPSHGMCTALREYAEDKGLENITIIEKRWEEVSEDDLDAPYDTVLASFSLGMPDISEAVRKMDAAASGEVCLFWHAGEPQFEKLYRMVWPAIYGENFFAIPKSDVLFNVLYSMGIYPDVKYFDFRHEHVFSSETEFAQYFESEHHLSYDPKNPVFREYLEQYVTKKDQNIFHRENLPAMAFRWSKKYE